MSAAAQIACELFAATLREIEIERLVARRVRVDRNALVVDGARLDLAGKERALVVALGKAARPLAAGIADVLAPTGLPTTGVVVSREGDGRGLPSGFEVFRGGHPLPDEFSLVAGRAALRAVRAADADDCLVVFAVSGGASALCECPVTLDITLDDLRVANDLLVHCGATIREINAVRRRLSDIKGGRLAAAAPRATQLSLLVSDVNPGDFASLGSGPSIVADDDGVDPRDVIVRYDLSARLPDSVRAAIARPAGRVAAPAEARVHVLADNDTAVEAALRFTRAAYDLRVERVPGFVEASVEDVAGDLAGRLARATVPTVFVGGGEAVCPVRGPGRGGRNQETVLRAAQRLAALDGDADLAVLSAGTDGVDGNSPAAGAWADSTTITRAAISGMRAVRYLDGSDSYEFFAALGQTLLTGAIENNVRDLRIAVALPAGSAVRRT